MDIYKGFHWYGCMYYNYKMYVIYIYNKYVE